MDEMLCNTELIIDTFVETINETSSVNTVFNFKYECIFAIHHITFNNLVTIKYSELDFTFCQLEKNIETTFEKNAFLAEKRKSISVKAIGELNLITTPVQKKNGEMVFFISIYSKYSGIEWLMLYTKMLSDIFYKNYTIKCIISKLQTSSSVHIKDDNALNLTQKENLIAEYLCSGYSDKRICSECKISISTLRKNISSIFQKLYVSSRSEFINKYYIAKVLSIYNNL